MGHWAAWVQENCAVHSLQQAMLFTLHLVFKCVKLKAQGQGT